MKFEGYPAPGLEFPRSLTHHFGTRSQIGRKIMRTRDIIIVAALSAVVWPAGAEVYKWTDETGQTHFEERKPGPGVEVEMIDVGRRGPLPIAATEPDDDPLALDDEELLVEDAPQPADGYVVDEPVICDGMVGATAVGGIAMALNRAYRASVPEFATDNEDVFASDEFYVCVEAIVDSTRTYRASLACEPETGDATAGEAACEPPDPHSMDGVLLEIAQTSADGRPDLVSALRALAAGDSSSWQQLQNYLDEREPRLEADIAGLTTFMRQMADDARDRALRSFDERETSPG